jgi:hypothetical protein
VRHIEDLPVDRNSRPLEEPTVKSCGELVKAVKGKNCEIEKELLTDLVISNSQKRKEEEEKVIEQGW